LEEPAASHRIVRLLLIGYLAFLVYASLYPISSFRPPEKNPFALLFGKMTISRTDALTNLPVPFLRWLAIWMPGQRFHAALVGCALSLTIEYFQAYLPGRVPSALDWSLNGAGTLLGAELAFRLGRIRWPNADAVLAAGPRARLGLIAVGTWVAAQLFPSRPVADIDYLKEV
jgi:VanZ family protein